MAIENIVINYDVINCEANFCVVKATANKGDASIQTFGSALKGESYKDGNTNTWYVMEMAEKRAMSRAVLKLTGFYELGVFGEDGVNVNSREFNGKYYTNLTGWWWVVLDKTGGSKDFVTADKQDIF
jgi:hypothetical protein